MKNKLYWLFRNAAALFFMIITGPIFIVLVYLAHLILSFLETLQMDGSSELEFPWNHNYREAFVIDDIKHEWQRLRGKL
jgi:hypothetical protein